MRTVTALSHQAVCGIALVLLLLSGAALSAPLYSGTVAYVGPSDDPLNQHPPAHHLNGTVDYAVWAAGTFPYVGTGYTPTPGDYVYTYLIHNDPASGPAGYTQVPLGSTSEVSLLSLIVTNPATNIGQSSALGGVASDPTQDKLDPVTNQSAVWSFQTVIQPGQDSYLLAFSSPNPPIFSPATLFDNGTSSVQPFQLPAPRQFPSPTRLYF